MNALTTIALLLSFIAGMNALTCNTCNFVSGLNSECNDPFPASSNFSTTCSSSNTYCQKSISKLNGEIATISRACAPSCAEQCISLFGIEGCNYCCQTNDCNGASAVTFSFVAMAAAILGAYVARL